MIALLSMKTTQMYFPVNDTQRSWGLYATCVGHSTTMPGDEFPSTIHPDEYFFTWSNGRILHEWQIIMVESGSGTVEFRHHRVKVKAGTIIILPPECWHRYRPSKRTGWTTLWIGFGGDLANRLVGGAGFDSEGQAFALSHSHRFQRIMLDAVDDILERGLENIYSAAAHIPMLIAALIYEKAAGDEDVSRAEIIRRAQSHIAAHAVEVVDFGGLAESLGMPYRTFRYLFAKETGTSPLQYQLNIRLTRAKSLLRSTDMPIAAIAKALGFNSTWYFAHFFRKHTATTAAAYRKKRQKAN